MALMKIVTGENEAILRTRCDEVGAFDKSLKKLVSDMIETMHDAKGLGIAAPQVNINARVFIVTLGYGGKDPRVVAMVNPEITYFSEETDVAEEGCLSLPKRFGNVERSVSIGVSYYDVKGVRNEISLEGLDARVVQHENDHINGVLFIDKLV